MKKNNILEILCFILFCIGTIIISCFHEPWFDEFQAWGISKDSIYNILFVIPHLEGHPPLWHLILKCFSCFNINPEIGIRIPNLLFMFGAVWLLIFKSPFPRIVRLTLPFTYFIFYQYPVICRPYSIFCFAIFLAALYYRERNNHPFKFVFALALLCLSCAYGMVISAGIILVWAIQILSGGGISEVIKTFIKDKRFYAMFLIFLLCLVLVLIMYPDKNVIYYAILGQLNIYKKFLYTVFIFPADSLCFNTSSYGLSDNLNINSNKFLTGCIPGFIINILFFFFFKSRNQLLLFYIPYLMLLFVFFSLYIASHHIGLLTIFYIFVFWIAITEPEKYQSKYLKNFWKYFICIILLIQLYWSICACFHDIIYPYSSSREIVYYINENKFYKYKIIARLFEPPFYVNKNTGEIIDGEPVIDKSKYKYSLENYQKIEVINNAAQSIGVIINLYFSKNIIYSVGINSFNKPYIVFKKKTPAEIKSIKEKLRYYGLPDFIINQSKPQGFFDDDELENIHYIPIKKFPNYHIWKNKYTKYYDTIYVRSDIYDKIN